MVERTAVNRLVVGSSPTSGARNYLREKTCISQVFFCFVLLDDQFEPEKQVARLVCKLLYQVSICYAYFNTH